MCSLITQHKRKIHEDDGGTDPGPPLQIPRPPLCNQSEEACPEPQARSAANWPPPLNG